MTQVLRGEQSGEVGTARGWVEVVFRLGGEEPAVTAEDGGLPVFSLPNLEELMFGADGRQLGGQRSDWLCASGLMGCRKTAARGTGSQTLHQPGHQLTSPARRSLVASIGRPFPGSYRLVFRWVELNSC